MRQESIDVSFDKMPKDWRLVVLGEIGVTYNGLTGKSKEDFGTGEPFIPYMNIFSNNSINPTWLEYVTISANENQNQVKYGDIFFTTSSETPKEVGMSSVLLKDIGVAYLNSFCFGFRLNDFNTLIPEYAKFLFRGKEVRKSIIVFAQGSTRFNLSKTTLLKRLTLLLPPLPEQQKIADILTTVDDKLENIESQIAEYTNLKTGLMQQLLTKGIGHTKFVDSELGMIPEGWKVMKLGKCIDLLTGFPFKSNEFSLNIKHTRLLRGINITEGSIRWNNEINRYWENITVELKKYFLSEDDLVISMDGSKVGKNYALVKKEELPLLLVQRVARIRPKSNLIIKYLYFIISSSHFLKYVESVKTSSGIPHISSKQINEFKILLPPKNEQQKIADILSSIEDKLDSLQVNKTECNKLKKGLMEQLLTGRIRVKV